MVYEESDEDCKSVFSNEDDDLAVLINNNNNSQEDQNRNGALITTSVSSEDNFDLAVDDLKKNIDNCEDLARKVCYRENNNANVRATVIKSEGGVQLYPVAGAFLGSCLGGPVGFLAGVKIGGLAAVGGGILGKFVMIISL